MEITLIIYKKLLYL